nr:DNA alkylation repair protein [Lachnospiraceae bacterium]
MKEHTRSVLIGLSEEKYRKFSSALTPGEEHMLGVRLPKLREIAKELAKGNWQEELHCEDVYFEETMLRGMVIGYATASMEEEDALVYIKDFVPYVTNWSVCDSVFMKMDVLKKDRNLTWDFILPYFNSGKEFSVRVALIIMMQHLMKSDNAGKKLNRMRAIGMRQLQDVKGERERTGPYLEKIFAVIDREFTEGYYAYMAAAWLIAECFCCFPALTNRFLTDCRLDDFTYRKALQKITESKIPDEEVKDYIRSLKKHT